MVSRRARASNTLGTRIGALQENVKNLESKTRQSNDTSLDDRLAQVELRLDQVGSSHFRQEEDLAVRGSNYAQALLDPTYIGPGPARVSFLPSGTLSSEKFAWRGAYYPWGNRVVNMIRVDDVWFIDTHSSQSYDSVSGIAYGGIVEIPLASGWRNYSDIGLFQYAEAQAQRLSSGIVVLSGLVFGNTVGDLTIIGNLPEGYRPDSAMMMPVLANSAQRAVTIQADGRITLRSGFTAGGFVSLDGIAFPAAGVASWTDIGSAGTSFQNGTTALSPGVYGAPGFWKDPYGLVWFRGLIAPGNTTSENASMATLNEDCRVPSAQFFPSAVYDGYGYVHATSISLTWRNHNSAPNFLSLSSVTNITNDALATGTWYTPSQFNSWANFDTVRPFNVTRRPDGMGLARGLLAPGSYGAGVKQSLMPRHMAPAMMTTYVRPSAAAMGRVDMYGHKQSNAGGQVNMNTGTTSWLGVDGMKWMVGEL